MSMLQRGVSDFSFSIITPALVPSHLTEGIHTRWIAFTGIVVDPNWRKIGLGSLLVKAILQTTFQLKSKGVAVQGHASIVWIVEGMALSFGCATNEAMPFWQRLGAIFETDEGFNQFAPAHQQARSHVNVGTDANIVSF